MLSQLGGAEKLFPRRSALLAPPVASLLLLAAGLIAFRRRVAQLVRALP